MLEDSDTRGLMAGIAKRDAPLSWFATDWPIENHFYRPVSTLTLEINHRVESLSNAAGFGLVNALLCILSVAALFWLVRELTDNPLLTALSVGLFALWNIDWQGLSTLANWIYYASWAVPLVLLLPNRDIKRVLSFMLVTGFLVAELTGRAALSSITLGWIPGRTATTMTIFALCALASYARFERYALVVPKPMESTDLPATKSSKHVAKSSRLHFLWPVAACLFTALALCSYEQAIMLPGLLVGIAIWFRIMRRRVTWQWHIAFWAVLFGYLALRHAILPSGVSQYQNQQFRSGPGLWLELTSWLAPCLHSIREFISKLDGDMLENGMAAFLVTAIPSLVLAVWSVASNAAAYLAMSKKLPMAFGAWSMSFLAFLPMAWLHRFDHYYYFPMALRSVFVVGLFAIAYQMIVTACSPRSIQAPTRLDPAPGSLPRP